MFSNHRLLHHVPSRSIHLKKPQTPQQLQPQTTLPAGPSAIKINAGEQLLQGLQLLIGLPNGAIGLHVAGDVVADVVHQRDGVGRVSLLHHLSILFDDLGKLGLLH